jgi:hypothetical protein
MRESRGEAAERGALNAAYISAALAYAWGHVSTDRTVMLAGIDHLTADFSAQNVGGRIEIGYRKCAHSMPTRDCSWCSVNIALVNIGATGTFQSATKEWQNRAVQERG